MTKTFKRIYSLLGVLAFLVSFFFGQFGVVAKAETPTIIEYDERSIYDDLADLDLNPDLYVQDVDGSPRAISFMEYCYSNDGWKSQGYYGLYIYVYNPMGKEVKTSGNVANMATVYGEDGKPTDYNNIPLKLLSATKSNLMLKFKVENAYERFYALEKKYAASNAANERRYDIAGVQLSYASKVDTTFATTFYFSGYSAGCGENTASESTLKCRSEGLETIKLNVNHTYYRTGAFVDNVCDELNTVYFSVPKRYFDEYGGLQKIKATWEEYKTTPIFATSDKDAYDTLKPFLFQEIGNRNDDCLCRVFWEEYWLIEKIYSFEVGYNRLAGPSSGSTLGKEYSLDGDIPSYRPIKDLSCMAWLFHRSGVSSVEDYNITSTEMKDYIEEVAEENKQYLFEDEIDQGRQKFLDGYEENSTNNPTCGRITQEIDAGEEKDLRFEKDQSWWDELWNGVQYEDSPYSPIVTFDDIDDLTGYSAEEFAAEYLIAEDDAEDVFTYIKDELKKDRYPVLFRFAKTDYYASNAYFDFIAFDGGFLEDEYYFTYQDGYVAQETVFLDFDLISLTFRDKGGADTVIPVVSNPIDIINGLEPPSNIFIDNGFDWDTFWKYVIIALIALVVLVPLIILIANLGVGAVVSAIGLFFKWIGIGLLYLFKGLWWLIKWPFIGIKKLFDVIFHREE